MQAKKFNELKKEVKNGNFKGLKKDVIQDLTLKQAQAIEDLMLDLELNKEGNQILDILVAYIDSLVTEEKKVANKKVPAKKEEKKEEEKKEPKKALKSQLKGNKETQEKLTDTIKVGDVVKFRVEGEEIEHAIKIVHIGKYNIIGVMAVDEQEVFNIRKSDFNKQLFAWKDRHNEEYNIIVTV